MSDEEEVAGVDSRLLTEHTHRGARIGQRLVDGRVVRAARRGTCAAVVDPEHGEAPGDQLLRQHEEDAVT